MHGELEPAQVGSLFQEVRRALFLPPQPLVQSRVRMHGNEVFPVPSDFHDAVRVELLVPPLRRRRLPAPALLQRLEVAWRAPVVRLSYVEQVVAPASRVRLDQRKPVQRVRGAVECVPCRVDQHRAHQEGGDVGHCGVVRVEHVQHQPLEGQVLQVDEVVEDEHLEFEGVVLPPSASASWASTLAQDRRRAKGGAAGFWTCRTLGPGYFLSEFQCGSEG